MEFNALWSLCRTDDLFEELKNELRHRNHSSEWEHGALVIVAIDVATRMNNGKAYELCVRMLEDLGLVGVSLDEAFQDLSPWNRVQALASSHILRSQANIFIKDQAFYRQVMDAYCEWKVKIGLILNSSIPIFPTALNTLILEY